MLSGALVIFTAAMALLNRAQAQDQDPWAPGDSKPNYVYFLADDMGFNDSPWQNATIDAPTLLSMAENGIIFNQFYAQPSCSPSRSALMSGRYPKNTGFNTGSLGSRRKAGLETTFKTIAERLGQLDYKSYMFGKWHIGNCKEAFLPHKRGFEQHIGIWHSGADKFDYNHEGKFDLHKNADPYPDVIGTYSTDMYTDEALKVIADHDANDPMFLYMAYQNVHGPWVAPDVYMNADTPYTERDNLKGMVKAMDVSIANIVQALKDKGMYDNTIFVFTSDNGAMPKKGGANNLPLRGGKNTWFEGGIRVPGMAFSELFVDNFAPKKIDCPVHITDWHTTFMHMSGYDAAQMAALEGEVDGKNQYEAMTGGACARTEILHNIITKNNGNLDSATLRAKFTDGKDYKIILGGIGKSNNIGWTDTNGNKIKGRDTTNYVDFMFNLTDDSEEITNLYDNANYAEVQEFLEELVERARQEGTYSFTKDNCKKKDLTDDDGNYITGCCA